MHGSHCGFDLFAAASLAMVVLVLVQVLVSMVAAQLATELIIAILQRALAMNNGVGGQ